MESTTLFLDKKKLDINEGGTLSVDQILQIMEGNPDIKEDLPQIGGGFNPFFNSIVPGVVYLENNLLPVRTRIWSRLEEAKAQYEATIKTPFKIFFEDTEAPDGFLATLEPKDEK